MSHWFLVAGAVIFEVIGTTSMKLSEGFTRPVPSALLFICYGLAFICMTLALKRIDVSVLYAIWSGLGTALIAVIGIVWFKEPVSAARIASIALIIVGVVGLNLASRTH